MNALGSDRLMGRPNMCQHPCVVLLSPACLSVHAFMGSHAPQIRADADAHANHVSLGVLTKEKFARASALTVQVLSARISCYDAQLTIRVGSIPKSTVWSYVEYLCDSVSIQNGLGIASPVGQGSTSNDEPTEAAYRLSAVVLLLENYRLSVFLRSLFTGQCPTSNPLGWTCPTRLGSLVGHTER